MMAPAAVLLAVPAMARNGASWPAGPDAIGYLGFGSIPGNVCADQPAAAATPVPAQ